MTRLVRLVAVVFLWTSPALAQTAAPPTQPAPAPAPAQTPTPPQPEYPIVRVGMLSYLQYAAELENRDGYNAFDVTRAYLNINAQLSPNLRFRFTPDVRRVTDGSAAGSLIVRVKYAFAQLDNVLLPRSWVRFGLQQTPWLDFEEGINRYRVQGQMFTERDGMIPGSADFGAGYFGPLGKYAEFHAGVYNGEGFGQTDANKYKSVQGRVTVRPLAGRGIMNGLRISGFYNEGWYAANRPRRLGIVMGSFEHVHVVSTVQYIAATENPSATAPQDHERRGSSAYVEIRQGLAGLAGLARADWLDPDKQLGDNSQRRVIAGGAYWMVWPRSRVGLVVTNEHVHYEPAAARLDENRLLVQTHIEF